MLTDCRILNGNPRATIIESFNGQVTVISPEGVGFQQFKHPNVEDAVKSIEARGWVVGISHLHGPNGRANKEAQKGGT